MSDTINQKKVLKDFGIKTGPAPTDKEFYEIGVDAKNVFIQDVNHENYGDREGYVDLQSKIDALNNSLRINSGSGSASGINAVAFGGSTQATGSWSFAAGCNAVGSNTPTTASGDGSHAEGRSTLSRGSGSHSEGVRTEATAEAAHAEGRNTRATGNASHAEGFDAQATNSSAHAEGYNTRATGDGSHAEGNTTIASGQNSHAEGIKTQALGQGSHAEGYYKREIYLRIADGQEGYLLLDKNKSKLPNWLNGYYWDAGFESEMEDGVMPLEGLKLYDIQETSLLKATILKTYTVENNGNYDLYAILDTDLNQEIEDDPDRGYYLYYGKALGSGSHSEGGGIAMGVNAHAEGSATWAAHHGHAEGFMSAAMNTGSHAEGIKSCARGGASHAEGRNTVAEGDAAHTEGYKTEASGNFSHAEGEETIASGKNSHAEGGYSYKIPGSTNNEAVMPSYSFADPEGFDHVIISTIAMGSGSHAEGLQTISYGYGAHAEGYCSQAIGGSSHAEGVSTIARGNYSHAEGLYTIAEGVSSHAEGDHTQASGSSTHAEGRSTQAIGFASHAEGEETHAYGNWAHAEGYLTTAEGDYSHAEGKNTKVKGYGSHVEGRDNYVEGGLLHVEGYGHQVAPVQWVQFNSLSGADLSHSYFNDGFPSSIYLDIVNKAQELGYSFVISAQLQRTDEFLDKIPDNFLGQGIITRDDGEQFNVLSYLDNTSFPGYLLIFSKERIFVSEGVSFRLLNIYQILKQWSASLKEGSHVQGAYASLDSKFLHVVGNGNYRRNSNAHTIDWDGNAMFAGDIEFCYHICDSDSSLNERISLSEKVLALETRLSALEMRLSSL